MFEGVAMALETKRLIVRTLREEDFSDFLEYAMDTELCRMLGWREMHTEEEGRKHFDRMLRSHTYLAIVHKQDKKVIGNIGLGNVMHIPALAVELEKDPAMKDKRGCALSFALSAPYRRQGIITEALIGVMDLLFRNDRFDYFNCGYLVFNEPSRMLQEKLGFHYYSKHQFGRIPNGPDIVENILLKEDFYRLHP